MARAKKSVNKRNIVFVAIFLILASVTAVVYFSTYNPISTQTTTIVTTVPATTTQPKSGATTTVAGAGTTTPTTIVDTGTFQPSVVTLEIKSWGFNPSTVTLLKGSTATWTNLDSVVHTVTSTGNFDSGDIAAGKPWTHTFNSAGTFEYSCKYHLSMKGAVVITE